MTTLFNQELLLILDEYWSAHPELHDIPIYYASSLAKKCMAVYQEYFQVLVEFGSTHFLFFCGHSKFHSIALSCDMVRWIFFYVEADIH